MQKAITIFVLFAILFSGFAALTPGAHAASATIADNWTVWEQNYTQMSQVPGNIQYDSYGSAWGNENSSISISPDGLELYAGVASVKREFSINGMYPALVTNITFRAKFYSDYTNGGAVYIYAHPGAFLTSNTGGFEIRVGKASGGTVSIWENSNSSYAKSAAIQCYDGNYHTFKILWDGINHTVSLTVDNITIAQNYPMWNMNTTLNLPPVYFISQLKFQPYIDGTYTHTVKVTIQDAKQSIKRKLITPLMPRKVAGLSFDERQLSTVIQNATPILKKYGYTATMMYGLAADGSNSYQNHTDLEKDGWITSFHMDYNPPKSSDIDNATAYYKAHVHSTLPKVMCTLQNTYTLNNEAYAYTTYGMTFREFGMPIWTGDYLINDTSYSQFEQIADATGQSTILYTHNVWATPDQYEVTPENFTHLIDTLHGQGYSVVNMDTFYGYLGNQYYFTASDIQRGDGYLKFTAHTNGYKAYIDVDFPHSSTVQVYDVTAHKYIKWEPGSVAFWVQNGHTYELKELINYNTGLALNWTYAMIGIMVPLVFFAAMFQFLGDFMQRIKKMPRLGGRH